ncbi:hypothetical protein BGZ60DRAFT_156034 [Tricladium varicosporioides]|nr:hypothetical protein BGZ60DRAFT_156034 [Hymenoscyphus varicosporioides]
MHKHKTHRHQHPPYPIPSHASRTKTSHHIHLIFHAPTRFHAPHGRCLRFLKRQRAHVSNPTRPNASADLPPSPKSTKRS